MLTRAPFWLCLAGLAAGAAAWVAASSALAGTVWLLTTALAAAPALWWVVQRLRQRRLGSDAIALLALLGTIAVQEYLAGAIIAVMLTGGQLLERRAEGRARRDLKALMSRAPKTAHRRQDGGIDTVDAAQVRPGDLLLVRAGEVLPVDGRVEGAPALLDESAVMGEPIPAAHDAGDAVSSGTVNAGNPFDMRATTDAQTSTYAGIVRLAREARAHNAPFVRMADRYAAAFLPLTLLIAGAAWWLSGDPVRAVAVLVVATPCPLILAAPIAFTSGLSRAARRGVVAKSGSALERLARSEVLLFDKTGTVTAGHPQLREVVTAESTSVSRTEALRLAASLDQVSPHVLVEAIVRAATREGLALALPENVAEVPGEGIRGVVEGRPVAVGKAAWAAPGAASDWVAEARRQAAAAGSVTVFVGVGGTLAAVLLLDDPIRPDAARTFRLLRQAGIRRAVMVTGDRSAVAEPIGTLVGADTVHAEQSPAGKVAVVAAETAKASTVMVGDGINDAPALASAGVGVALGARGATASSEAADVVITVDRLERLAETLAIARRSRAVATQSVVAGMGLSLLAMLFAAAGALPPTAGALLQEGIDIAVILNALRALGGGPAGRAPRLRGDSAELVRRLDEEHQRLWPGIRCLPAIAAAVGGPAPLEAGTLSEIEEFARAVAAHERDDERLLYPRVARVLGGSDPTGTMSRGHTEISALLRRIASLAADLRGDAAGSRASQAALSQALLELYAVLKLHFAQEEESYHSLVEDLKA